MAFQIKFSYFKYKKMLFRLFNAVASFYGYINEILTEKLNIFIIINLDHIFFYIKNLKQVCIGVLQ